MSPIDGVEKAKLYVASLAHSMLLSVSCITQQWSVDVGLIGERGQQTRWLLWLQLSLSHCRVDASAISTGPQASLVSAGHTLIDTHAR